MGGASSSFLSAGRSLVPPPAGYFPAMESNQRSPGLRARTLRRGEIRSIPFPAKAENCIALLCPSFSPPDPLRWAPAGAPTGGRRWRYGACKPFGCYPPFWPPPSILRPLAPRADIPLARLVSSCPAFGCTHAARRWYQPLQDGFGVESAGCFFLAFSFARLWVF